ncbi:hypothetical protein M422DRAFT_250650 [Sphaerobolus stellatus SS14]|uniref:F-box domain-containing protein n=1 Tax=Sphaerobolus stellatus (strain SS14) TaxID=990650 RepID=A0A0C9VTF7_SPHS4|nr:hypothetical protein M422DRAFT_250650 [Sphaerobolus stellatus SS14]
MKLVGKQTSATAGPPPTPTVFAPSSLITMSSESALRGNPPDLLGLLPLELTDSVLQNVSSPVDLVSFALTKRSLYKEIIPWHLAFRHIRCDPRRHYLWKWLAQNKVYASRVRVLELVFEDEWCFGVLLPKLPSSIGEESGIPVQYLSRHHFTEHFPVITQAIQMMTSLERFSGGFDPYPFNITRPLTDSPLKKFYEELVEFCPNLLVLECRIQEDSQEGTFPVQHYFRSFTGLVQLSLVFRSRALEAHDCDPLIMECLMTSSSSLKDLHLAADMPISDDGFSFRASLKMETGHAWRD